MSHPTTKIEAEVTISRRSGYTEHINISIKDRASRTEFVDLAMSLEDFALCLTGRSSVPATGEVRGLANIGLMKEVESRTARCPLQTFDRATLEQWLVDNCQEEGWILNPSLRSQHSIGHAHASDGTRLLRYSVIRYVPKGSE